MDLEFTPVEAKQFEEALLSAFPKRTNLERMVLFRLGQELDQIVPDGNLTDNVFNLILWAASQGQTRALLEAAHEEVPGNAKLHAFYLQIKAPPVTPPQSSASSTIDLARALIGRPLPPSEAIPLLDALGDLEDADQRRVQLRVRLQDGNSFESALSSGLTNGVYFFIHPITKETNQPRPREISEITVLSVRDSIGIPKDSVVLPPKALTQEMRWQLVDSVMRIPTSEEVDGRTGYLAGLPTPLRRNPYDALTDLNMIFSQLDGLGRLDSGQWPLLLVIDNILQYVQGFPDVRNLIIKVKQSLEQAYSRY